MMKTMPAEGSMQRRKKLEIEGFGVSYDRYVMARQQGILTEQLQLESVLESPSHGAKAAGSLYSVGYALSGCNVTLVNSEEEPLTYWQKLGILDKLTSVRTPDTAKLPFSPNSFDLAWNFVTFTELENPDAWLDEMIRVSKGYVMIIACNNFQVGYPWHRLIHRLWGFSWNHGNVHYNYPWTVKKWFRKHGLCIAEAGTIDSPPWPDPVGFRDIRLHKNFSVSADTDPIWEVPMMDCLKTGDFPWWIKALSAYDIPLRRGYWKLPFSHLFYVLGRR